MRGTRSRLLLAGGGSGGHVWPGVALADAWSQKCREMNVEPKVLFVGASGGLEAKIIPTTPYPLRLLKIGSLKRVGWIKRLQTLWRIPMACLKSCWILAEFRPHAVVGIGGYASGPLVLMAALFGRWFGVKTAILEPNAVSGLTNRVLGNFVDRIFVNPFNQSVQKSVSKKMVFSGTPIRSAFLPLSPAPSNPFVIFVFGGSQGAVGMNTLIMNALKHLEAQKDRIHIIHQTGEVDFERVSKFYNDFQWPHVQVEKFILDMKSMYEKASLVICRAGAGSIAELIQVRRPAILVPLPTAADNHQEWNAKGISEGGAAFLVHQNQTPPQDLARKILEYVQKPEVLLEMVSKLESFSRPRAAQTVVEDLIQP